MKNRVTYPPSPASFVFFFFFMRGEQSVLSALGSRAPFRQGTIVYPFRRPPPIRMIHGGSMLRDEAGWLAGWQAEENTNHLRPDAISAI